MRKARGVTRVVATFIVFSTLSALTAFGCSSGAPTDEESSNEQQALECRDGAADRTAIDALSDRADDDDDAHACRKYTLKASVSFTRPKTWNDAVQSFSPPFTFALPASLPVTVGNAGNKEAWLSISRGREDDDAHKCKYVGSSEHPHPKTPGDIAAGEQYVFDSCDGEDEEGDLRPGRHVTASSLKLHVQNGDDKDPANETEVELVLEERGHCNANDAAADAPMDAVRDAVADASADASAADAAPDVAVDANSDGPTCTAASCNDNNLCTTDTCNPDGTCSHSNVSNGTSCSDGNACNGAETCQSGSCTPGTPVVCSAQDQCHVAGTCDPSTGACSNPIAANGTACNDGNACTQSDTCQSGVCTGTNPLVCAASDQCHAAGVCDPSTGTCSNPAVANGTACNDGNSCTTADVCSNGTCSGAPVTCAPLDACHVAGTCDPASGACSSPLAPVGTICGSSTNLCTGVMACNASGACVQQPPVPIDTSNQCMVGTCNPATGTVTYAPAPTGTACGDNSNKCVGAYACNGSGTCVQGPAPVIDDGNPCTTDSCNSATGVQHVPIPGCVLPPPDPSTIAPPIDPTVPTDIYTANSYLFTGSNAIQTGVAPGIIDPRRIVILRGSAIARDGSPVVTATVSILGHPEFGQTLTRADGAFTMAANGGAPLIVEIKKQGFVPAHRNVDSRWREHVNAPQVVLVPYDTTVTPLSFGSGAPAQIARGSTVNDADGTRTTTLLIPSGTQGVLRMPDGSTQPLTTAHFRATEFTVGATGPKAMPAELPPSSGYTFAVALDLDEEFTAGALHVEFDRPIPVYVDNFLGFPVGTIVPSGYYDRIAGRWQAAPDGRVIRVLTVTGGTATLDTNGDGIADDNATLGALGISAEELAQIAQTYSSGASLWRVPVTHFSDGDPAWDFNQPAGPPPDAVPPDPPEGDGGGGGSGGPTDAGADASNSDAGDGGADAGGDATVPSAPPPNNTPPDPCADKQGGSIIGCERLTLGEELPIAGTGAALHYESDRVDGYVRNRTLQIRLTGGSLPASLKRVEAKVEIAGRTFALGPFPATPNQTTTFVWDGKDAEGRILRGAQLARITIGFVYPMVYLTPAEKPGAGYDETFGHFSYYGSPVTSNATAREVTIYSRRTAYVGGGNFDRIGAEGWSLTPHHVYDPNTGTLYRGDGSWVVSSNIAQAVSQPDTIHVPFPPGQPPPKFVVGADGSFFYFSDGGSLIIYRVAPDGTRTTIYQDSTIQYIGGYAIGPDGSLYVGAVQGTTAYKLLRISQTGQATTIAGTGVRGVGGQGGPAVSAQIGEPRLVAVDRNNNIYLYDVATDFNTLDTRRISEITPDGKMITLIRFDNNPYAPVPNPNDGVPASQAYLGQNVSSLTVASDGSIYFIDTPPNKLPGIRRIRPNGFVELLAYGNAPPGGGGPTPAPGKLAAPQALGPAPSGGVYVCDRSRLLEIRPGGQIRTLLGDDNAAFGSTQVCGWPSLAVAPSGDVYTDAVGSLLRIGSALPGFSLDDIAVPDASGRVYHVFSGLGRHKRTVDVATGVTLFTFTYDATGRLASITDVDGDTITVQSGASIVGPFGHRTVLNVPSGLLASITDPAGAVTSFTYGNGNLLASTLDANKGLHSYAYDSNGLLQSDSNPSGLVKTASQVASLGSSVSQIKTTLGRTSVYRSQVLDDSHVSRSHTTPDGLTVTTTAGDSTSTTTYPDGSIVTSTLGPDPIFGNAARFETKTTITLPSGLTKSIAYSRAAVQPAGNPLGVNALTDTVSYNGRNFTRGYTSSNATVRLSTPTGRYFSTQLDSKGRVVAISTPNFGTLTLTRDSHGRVATASIGSRSVSYVYGSNGAVTSMADETNQTSSFGVDANGRIVQWTLPDGSSGQTSYDANGNPLSIQPPSRPAHSFAFGAGDLLAAYTPPSVSGNSIGTTTYSYNQDAQLAKLLRPDAIAITPTYDAVGRLISVTDGSENLAFAYDATSGRVSSVTTASGQALSFVRDGFLLTDSIWSGPVAGAIHRTYNNDFRISNEQVQGTAAIPYGYDADGLITTAGAESLSYDAQNGSLLSTSVGSVTDALTYSTYGEVATYAAQFQSTSTLLSVSYTRDNGGRISSKQETIGGQTHTTSYQYDSRGRLVQVSMDGTPIESSQYDANGNRTQLVAGGVTTAGTYDTQDKLISWGAATFAYNANGDLISKSDASGTTSYTYDGFGTLRHVSLPNGQAVDYVIDGRGRRVAKNVNGTRVAAWLYANAFKPVAQLDASGNAVSRFVYGRTRLVPDYMISGGTTYRLLTDINGSVRLVVDVATGTVAQRIDYDAWGHVTNDTNPGFQPFGFAGGTYDPDTKLVRFGAREYDASIGRWTTTDPARFAGSASNFYEYAYDDPINLIDPRGLGATAAAPGIVWQVGSVGARGATTVGTGVGAGELAAAAGEFGVAGAAGAGLLAMGAWTAASTMADMAGVEALDEGPDEGGPDDEDPCEKHHVFPQKYRDEFEKMGIDIDKWTVKIPRRLHRKLTKQWEEAFDDLFSEGTPTARQATDLVTELMNDWKIAHLPWTRY